MSLTITDDQLRAVGLTAEEAQVEIACRLYGAERLSMPEAVKWSGLTRIQFEAALLERGLWIVKPTLDELEADFEAIRGWDSDT